MGSVFEPRRTGVRRRVPGGRVLPQAPREAGVEAVLEFSFYAVKHGLVG